MKSSGTQLEVSWSRLAERGGVGKGGVVGVKDTAKYISVCRVIIDAFGNIFLHFSIFLSNSGALSP